MIGLGDPERIVIDCAGDQWRTYGPGGSVVESPCPDEVASFVSPTEATRRWAQWLSDARSSAAPGLTLTVLAPSVFGAPRRSLVAAGAAAIGHRAEVLSRAGALVQTCGILFCRRALVVECRGETATAHVLDLVDDQWLPVAAAVHPDPVRAALAIVDDGLDQALIDGPTETVTRVRDALADAGLWRVIDVDLQRLAAGSAGPQQHADAESYAAAAEVDAELSSARPRRARPARPWVAATAVAGTVAVAAGVVSCLPSGVPPTNRQVADAPAGPEPDGFVEVAFDGAVVDLPRGWSVTEPAPGRRVAEATDGRRVTVVRTALHAPTDRAVVAEELRAALAQRGDQRISALNSDGMVAGRDVIGYREQVTDGRMVDWYVVVAGSAQLSVGCEGGRSAVPLAAVCERAVSTVRTG